MELSILLKALHDTVTLRNEFSKKKDYKTRWDMPVQIQTTSHLIHGGKCTPSLQNLIITYNQSGHYVRNIPTLIIFQFCASLEDGKHLKCETIRETICPHWPKNKEIGRSYVFNIRVSVLRLLPKYRQSNKDHHAFKEQVSNTDLLTGIDNATNINEDEAYELASSLWSEVYNNEGT